MSITQRVEALGACKLIGTHPAGSPAWLEQRREGIGGSDVAPILNISPYTSALTLFYQKLGVLPEVEATIPMKLGTYLESGILQVFREEYPTVRVYPGNFTFASNEDSRYRANPDAIIEDSYGNLAILEIKHTGQYWSELPLHYKYQVLWYMFVTGIKNPATVYAVTGGTTRAFTVEWDESLMSVVKSAVGAFCALLEAQEAPSYDGSDSTYQTVRELAPGVEDREHELECATELMTARQIFEAAEQNLQKYKAIALDELNGARVGTWNGTPIVTLQQRGAGKPYIQFTKGN